MANPASLHDVLRRFARTMAQPYNVTDALVDLCDGVADVLGADGAGVSVADEAGMLRFVAATTETVASAERAQERNQEGPCFSAFGTGIPSVVPDLRQTDRWPGFQSDVEPLDVRAVLGLPLTIDETRIGALNVYHSETRAWSDDDVNAAFVLADITTAYLIRANEADELRRTAAQLQEALDSRVVIEQAKGKLAGQRGISVDEAFTILRNHARSHNATLRSVAQAVVDLDLDPGSASAT